MDLNIVQVIAVYAIPVILAITLHEAAHGYVAMRFGDMTAYAAGRVSLNPIRHIDPVGTVALPLALLALTKLIGGGGMLFGWAKPVPVNFANLRRPKQDMFWVAAAGPFSNLAMSLAWACAYKIGSGFVATNPAVTWLVLVGACGIFVNVIFMVLNLLPLPPLDGGRIAVSLLPHRLAWQLSRVERYGFIILIVLLVTGLLGHVLCAMIGVAVAAIGGLFRIAPGDLFGLIQA